MPICLYFWFHVATGSHKYPKIQRVLLTVQMVAVFVKRCEKLPTAVQNYFTVQSEKLPVVCAADAADHQDTKSLYTVSDPVCLPFGHPSKPLTSFIHRFYDLRQTAPLCIWALLKVVYSFCNL